MNSILEDLQKVKEQQDGLDMFSYDVHGEYSIEEVEEEFGSWSKAKDKVASSKNLDKNSNPRGKGVSEADILSDMRKVARSSSLPFNKQKYAKKGKYDSRTVSKNIGSWQKARERADIKDIEKEKAVKLVEWVTKKLEIKKDLSIELKEIIHSLDKALDEKLVLGALYCAIRQNDLPYSMRDIAYWVPDVDKQDIYESYRYLLSKDKQKYIPTISVKSFVERYSKELDFPKKRIEELKDLAKNLETHGSSPHAVAAALVYLTGQDLDKKITQKIVAEKANITKVTLRNRKKDLEEELDIKEL